MGLMTGKAVVEGMRGMGGMRNLFGLGPGAELLYSFVIIFCSLMIYYGTKELYELSSYKGIKYFRQTFLFFAFAYFFRSVIKFIIIYFNVNGILDFSPNGFRALGLITQIIFVYFSSMAIFSLLRSVMWKRWNNRYASIVLHSLAIVLAISSILFRTQGAYLILNLFILFVALFAVYISYRDRRNNQKKIYLVYGLLSLFWVFNIIDALVPNLFQGFQLFIYLISIGIFLSILYKVIKNVGSN